MSAIVEGGLGADPDAPAAQTAVVDERQHFVFRVGATLIAVPPTSIDRVVPPLKAVRVPTAPAQVLGVAHLQGRIVTIVSLRQALGLAESAVGQTNEARTLVLRAGSATFAAEVQQVLGLRTIAATLLRVPQRADGSHQAFVHEYDGDEGTVTVLDVERLFTTLSMA